jgi:hypothetical protein
MSRMREVIEILFSIALRIYKHLRFIHNSAFTIYNWEQSDLRPFFR